MNQLAVITYFDNNEPLEWGLKLHLIKQPFIILAHPDLKDSLISDNSNIEIIFTEIHQPLLYFDSIKLLHLINQKNILKTENLVFIESVLLYKYISFDALYDGLLTRFILKNNFFNHSFSNFIVDKKIFYSISKNEIQNNLNDVLLLNNRIIVNAEFGEFNHSIQSCSLPQCDINLYLSEQIESPILHIIGDSHTLNTLTPNDVIGCRSNILFNLNRYNKNLEFEYQFTHHLGSQTLFGFCRNNQYGKAFFNELGIKDKHTLVFVLGEIDIRSHVFKYENENKSIDIILTELVDMYMEKLNEIILFFDVRVLVMGVIPPMDGPHYQSDKYPIIGILEKRIWATKFFNMMLKDKCTDNGFSYFEVNQFFQLEDGSLDHTKSDFFCHVNHHYNGIAIQEMLNTLVLENEQIL